MKAYLADKSFEFRRVFFMIQKQPVILSFLPNDYMKNFLIPGIIMSKILRTKIVRLSSSIILERT